MSLQLANFIKNQAILFMENFKMNNIEGLIKSTLLIRKSISFDEIPPAKLLVDTEIVPFIIKLLDDEYISFLNLQYEVCWIVLNLTVSQEIYYINIVVEQDAIKRLLNLFLHKNSELVNLV